MRRGLLGVAGVVVIVVAIALYLSMFIVSQTQQALVVRFGQVTRQVRDPGLYFKLPLVENVVYFDKRILDLDSPPLEVIASDQKRLVVDAFGRFRIINPLFFYQSVGTIPIAQSRLSDILNSSVRQVIGDSTFDQLVRDERAALMARIAERVDREANRFGIDMIDVKIRRADLPEANSQAIYQRMQTERQREAADIRARGEEQARRIRAEADRTATVIVAVANQESERLRGTGEAGRNRILADAFNVDPDFFAFYRSMQAYQQGLGGPDTRLVITPDSEFFRYFNAPGDFVPTTGAAPSTVPDLGSGEAPAVLPDASEGGDASETTTGTRPADSAAIGDGSGTDESTEADPAATAEAESPPIDGDSARGDVTAAE